MAYCNKDLNAMLREYLGDPSVQIHTNEEYARFSKVNFGKPKRILFSQTGVRSQSHSSAILCIVEHRADTTEHGSIVTKLGTRIRG